MSGIVLELLLVSGGTLVLSSAMRLMLSFQMFKDIADNGYKIDVDDFTNKIEDLKMSDAYQNNTIKLCKYVPFACVFQELNNLAIYGEYKSLLLDQFIVLNCLEQMSKEEFNNYKKHPSGLNALIIAIKSGIKKEMSKLENKDSKLYDTNKEQEVSKSSYKATSVSDEIDFSTGRSIELKFKNYSIWLVITKTDNNKYNIDVVDRNLIKLSPLEIELIASVIIEAISIDVIQINNDNDFLEQSLVFDENEMLKLLLPLCTKKSKRKLDLLNTFKSMINKEEKDIYIKNESEDKNMEMKLK